MMGKAIPATRAPKGCSNEEFVNWLENYKPTHMYFGDRMRAYVLVRIGINPNYALLGALQYDKHDLAQKIRERWIDEVVEKLK
jgi:hypothetical protein